MDAEVVVVVVVMVGMYVRGGFVAIRLTLSARYSGASAFENRQALRICSPATRAAVCTSPATRPAVCTSAATRAAVCSSAATRPAVCTSAATRAAVCSSAATRAAVCSSAATRAAVCTSAATPTAAPFPPERTGLSYFPSDVHEAAQLPSPTVFGIFVLPYGALVE